METKYGLRIGILNIGTLREKEEVTLLMEERRTLGDKGKDQREKSHPQRLCLFVVTLEGNMVWLLS